MKTLHTALLSSCLLLAASTAFAQDAMKKSDAMAPDAMKKEPTMQQCKDHMAMQSKEKDAMKKSDAMMKMEQSCTAMMKKDGMMKDGAAAPMKK